MLWDCFSDFTDLLMPYSFFSFLQMQATVDPELEAKERELNELRKLKMEMEINLLKKQLQVWLDYLIWMDKH